MAIVSDFGKDEFETDEDALKWIRWVKRKNKEGFTEHDAEALFEIKYDEQVLKYDPTFIKRDATMSDIKEAITFWQDDGRFS